MKKYFSLLLVFVMILSLMTGCGGQNTSNEESENTTNVAVSEEDVYEGAVIELSDNGILVDGVAISEDTNAAVYKANDIVYYEAGKDFTYGEGTETDAHTKEEADAHTVVHITKPGQYVVSGELSKGQIAVDLGEDAKDDPNAVVTLVLNHVQMTCEVAPAIIFYNVYECGVVDTEKATKDVDTSNAGANVIIADDTFNIINGSYVARIYKEGTVELSEDGTKVVDAEKLHKYDAAFYSKMSMNINSGSFGSGILVINAENEGLDSELHLTINGGCIQIESGNDGINTNEDGVSVTTINGGTVSLLVNGSTGEGDGIDSNGWLVINGGSVLAQACSFSGDAGIDSDMGIHINGGKVIATGNMLDRISDSTQNYVVLNFAETQKPGQYMLRTNETNNGSEPVDIVSYNVTNDFTCMIISNSLLTVGEYTLWYGDKQLQGVKVDAVMGGMTPPMGGERPDNFDPNTMKPDMEGMTPPERPEGGEFIPPEGGFEGGHPGRNPDGTEGLGRGPGGNGQFDLENSEVSKVFTITDGGNYFANISFIE